MSYPVYYKQPNQASYTEVPSYEYNPSTGIMSKKQTPPAPVVSLKIVAATATSNDGNVPGNAIDGKVDTRWSAQGSGQKLFLDLGGIQEVSQVDVTWYSYSTRAAKGSILVDNIAVVPSFLSKTNEPIMKSIFTPTQGKQVTIVCNGNTVNDWNSISEVKVLGKQLVEPTPGPTPIPEPCPPGFHRDLVTNECVPDGPGPEPEPTTGLDAFGTKMIYPTKSGGRVFNAPFLTGSQRTLNAGQRDGSSDLKPLGSGTYTIMPSTGEMKISGGAPRVYVFDEARQKLFENVETTCYYKRISGNLATYQGFEIGIRGEHELGGSQNARVYYYRHSINGIFGKMKEEVHPNTLDTKTVKNGVAFNTNTWYGLKFITRTMSNGNVKLESYQDLTDGKNGGTWTKMDETIDNASAPWGGWPVYKVGTPRCGCHSVFARTDNATDFRIKKFSIREVGIL